jgi:hypothetical protein
MPTKSPIPVKCFSSMSVGGRVGSTRSPRQPALTRYVWCRTSYLGAQRRRFGMPWFSGTHFFDWIPQPRDESWPTIHTNALSEARPSTRTRFGSRSAPITCFASWDVTTKCSLPC